ncbi:MAG: hypothetical protein NC930_04810 [Candidatus Omnitrophica bacterium]|nr:hypothetical protein [Candidatus Omnitrophota bacterium]
MKDCGKVLAVLAMVSCLIFLYLYPHMSLFRVSYAIAAKSAQVARRSEEYRLLKYEVDQLRAPRLLEARMKNLQMDLCLPREVRIVRIPTIVGIEPAALNNVSIQPFHQGLFDLLGRWVKVAQAKTES